MSRDLTAALVEVCDETLRRLPPSPTRSAVEAVRARLLSPLRVAVAGSVSSGKSTLVNALLGQRVAPVDAGECTRLVTWYRYDHHQRIEVQRRDGTVHTLPFAAGSRLPDDLGVPPDDVARLVVHLSNERLRELTIIDTPGLNTVTDENQRAATEALGLASREATDAEGRDSEVAMSDADALLFLTPHVRESDVEVLERFRSLFDASGLSSANAVGILSKVDRLAPDGDPWPVAQRLATAARERLTGVVSEVVPVMGLLAETAATDQFTEDDAYALEALARLDELDLEDALISPQDLLEADVPDVSRDQLRRLLSMLDLHGIAVGVELVQTGSRGAGALLRGFRSRSGLDPLTGTVETGFSHRASALKARGGLSDLRRIASRAQGEDAEAFRAMAGPLERIELDPALHDLRILDALRRVEEGAARLPADLLDALRRLALETTPARQLGLPDSADPGELARAASRAVAAWARYGNDSRRSPDERRLAEDVREWYELVWDEATPRPAPPVPPSPQAHPQQPAYPQQPAQPPPPGYPQPSPGHPQPQHPPPATPAPATGYPPQTPHPQPQYPPPGQPPQPGHPQPSPPSYAHQPASPQQPGYPQHPQHPQAPGSPSPYPPPGDAPPTQLPPPGYPPPQPPPAGYPQQPGYPQHPHHPPAPGSPSPHPPPGHAPLTQPPPAPPPHGPATTPQLAAPPPRQPRPTPPPPPARPAEPDDDDQRSTPWTRPHR